MEKLSKKIISKPARPERVLQFGEGVFLRAFADEMIDRLNELGLFDGSIVVVPPTERGSAAPLNSQDCLYTVLLRGLEGGAPKSERRVVTSVSRAVNAYADYAEYIACARNPDLRVIISNTTEAGISYDGGSSPDDAPPRGFPAKIASFLYERFKFFKGDAGRGLAIIPCELIDNNGATLKATALRHAREWGYGGEFETWVNTACVFADTLVDRIVSGYPADVADALAREQGYEDALLVAGELYHLWAIRADAGAIDVRELLPFDRAGLNVIYTGDVGLYGARKIRLLNGAHTALAACACRDGFTYVGEASANPLYGEYLRILLYEEIPASLAPGSDDAGLSRFADSVLERFASPFIRHRLTGIMLNAASKYKMRLLPSLLEYHRHMNKLPDMLCFSLASLFAYYKTGAADEIIRDDGPVPEFFNGRWASAGNDPPEGVIYNLARHSLGRGDFWGFDLNTVSGLAEKVSVHLVNIVRCGVAGALRLAISANKK
jgi:tagaturonate reductase